MTATDFHTRRRRLGLSAEAFGALTGCHPSTVLGWGKRRSRRDVQDVPVWAALLLEAWERHPDLLPQDRPTAAE